MTTPRLAADRLPRRPLSVGLLELTLVVILIGIFITVAIDRIWPLRITAERTAVLEVQGALESALGITIAGRVARGAGLSAIARLQGTNPIRFLATPPANYVGSFTHPRRHRIPPGSWYFDRRTRTLVYLVRFRRHFETPLTGPKRIRFRVELVYRGKRHRLSGLAGVRLVQLNPYRWRAR